MPLTPEQIASKWERNLSGARQSYIDGINGVTESPMVRAIAAEEKWNAAMQEVIANGTWVNGLEAAGTLQEWKTRTIEVGAARLISGASAARPKVQRFFQRWMPILQRNLEQVRAMPSTTFQDRIQRMVRMAELNHDSAGQVGN